MFLLLTRFRRNALSYTDSGEFHVFVMMFCGLFFKDIYLFNNNVLYSSMCFYANVFLYIIMFIVMYVIKRSINIYVCESCECGTHLSMIWILNCCKENCIIQFIYLLPICVYGTLKYFDLHSELNDNKIALNLIKIYFFLVSFLGYSPYPRYAVSERIVDKKHFLKIQLNQHSSVNSSCYIHWRWSKVCWVPSFNELQDMLIKVARIYSSKSKHIYSLNDYTWIQPVLYDFVYTYFQKIQMAQIWLMSNPIEMGRSCGGRNGNDIISTYSYHEFVLRNNTLPVSVNKKKQLLLLLIKCLWIETV